MEELQPLDSLPQPTGLTPVLLIDPVDLDTTLLTPAVFSTHLTDEILSTNASSSDLQLYLSDDNDSGHESRSPASSEKASSEEGVPTARATETQSELENKETSKAVPEAFDDFAESKVQKNKFQNRPPAAEFMEGITAESPCKNVASAVLSTVLTAKENPVASRDAEECPSGLAPPLDLAKMGLPTAFKNCGQTVEKKSKVVLKFVCQVCKITLNSEANLKSHIQGMPHQKKVAKMEGREIPMTKKELSKLKAKETETVKNKATEEKEKVVNLEASKQPSKKECVDKAAKKVDPICLSDGEVFSDSDDDVNEVMTIEKDSHGRRFIQKGKELDRTKIDKHASPEDKNKRLVGSRHSKDKHDLRSDLDLKKVREKERLRSNSRERQQSRKIKRHKSSSRSPRRRSKRSPSVARKASSPSPRRRRRSRTKSVTFDLKEKSQELPVDISNASLKELEECSKYLKKEIRSSNSSEKEAENVENLSLLSSNVEKQLADLRRSHDRKKASDGDDVGEKSKRKRYPFEEKFKPRSALKHDKDTSMYKRPSDSRESRTMKIRSRSRSRERAPSSKRSPSRSRERYKRISPSFPKSPRREKRKYADEHREKSPIKRKIDSDRTTNRRRRSGSSRGWSPDFSKAGPTSEKQRRHTPESNERNRSSRRSISKSLDKSMGNARDRPRSNYSPKPRTSSRDVSNLSSRSVSIDKPSRPQVRYRSRSPRPLRRSSSDRRDSREKRSTSHNSSRNVLVGGDYREKMARPYAGKFNRLCKRIRDSIEPVVGLKFISEWFACSQALEPYYECDLCSTHGKVEVMMSHVLGKLHREKYMDKVHGLTGLISKGRMMEILQKHDDRFAKKELIETFYSDEQYPWPTTKAPWAEEVGGSGYVPTFAQENLRYRRENYNKTDEQLEEEAAMERERAELEESLLPVMANVYPDEMANIKSRSEMLHYTVMLRSLLKKISIFHQAKCDKADRVDLDKLNAMVDYSLVMTERVNIISEKYLPEDEETQVLSMPIVKVKREVDVEVPCPLIPVTNNFNNVAELTIVQAAPRDPRLRR